MTMELPERIAVVKLSCTTWAAREIAQLAFLVRIKLIETPLPTTVERERLPLPAVVLPLTADGCRASAMRAWLQRNGSSSSGSAS